MRIFHLFDPWLLFSELQELHTYKSGDFKLIYMPAHI